MEPQELVEHRYRAVLEVLDGAPVVEVALRFGVSRQTVHSWRNRYRDQGVEGLREQSRRPRTSPTRLPADVEALICELRQHHPRWGARRLAHELGQRKVQPLPSRATVHRVLSRNGLVSGQNQQHKRKYRRWQRDAPMQLWQMDIVSGVFLADGRECKLVTGIDDHSRFLVVAEVVLRPTGRDVCSAFVASMQRYGVPTEMLTDNGKQFTGRFTKPRPAEVLFERVCRENGIVQRLTKRRSPTTTGKIERFHRTLRQEFLDHVAPFESVAAAQEAINTWVHTYNHQRPHQSLDMATPASRFRPSKADAAASLQGAGQLPLAIPRQSTALKTEQMTDPARRPTSAGAVEFDVVVPPCGHFALSRGGQDIWIGPAFAGKTVTLWADDRSIHITMDGHLLKTMASRTSLEQLHQLREKRQTRPAGPPPAAPALPRHRGRVQLPAGMAVEVERTVDRNGIVALAQQDIKLPVTLAGRRVILRMDEHVLHAVSNGRVVRTMPLPISADQRGRLRGVRQTSSLLPPSGPAGPAGPLIVQRRVNIDGFLMVAKQRMRVGPTHVGKIVNVIVEDTHFRIVHDGEELAVHARTSDRPVSRFKAWASSETRPRPKTRC